MDEVENSWECAGHCASAHGKKTKKMTTTTMKHGSPVLSSFFKVMIGRRFSDVLFIPPKFARTMSTLANHTVRLEDSTGRQWEVMVSEHDGSYAFLGGWNSFSSDQGLEIGDFLVFFYLGSRFLVKVYDKTGCEKQDRPKSKKRRRTTSTAIEGRHKTSESPGHSGRCRCSTNSQASNGSDTSDASAELSRCCSERKGIKVEAEDSTPLCPDAKGWTEELLCVVDRGMEEEEFRAALDLSNFETCKENNVCSEGVSKRCRMLAGNSNKLLISRGKSQSLDAGAILINSESEVCVAEACPGERLMLIQSEQQLMSLRSIQPMQLQISCDPKSSVLGKESKKDAKERVKWVEQVGITSNFDAYAPRDPSSSSAADCSCTVKITAVCRNNLDLPRNLPAAFFRGGKNKNRRMLFLQDPMQRLWPVVYQENNENRFLSHGWEGFHNAHNLKHGDDCIFKVRDKTKALFGVCIVRR